ncbi:MAG: hypothetical protein ACYST9_03750 [Planctomycetota bacterium]|jgi:hypothetical protein
MKRTIIVLAILMIATPAMAAVNITTAQGAECEVIVSYENTNVNKVRAISLDIQVSTGSIVTVTEVSDQYTIYPGSIVVDPCDPGEPGDGVVVAPGSAICDGSEFEGTLLGLGTAGMTLEMASLYLGAPNAPNDTGIVCKFIIDSDATVTVTENTIRGGVVMEDPQEDPGVVLPAPFSATCGCTCVGDLVDDGQPAPVSVPDLMKMLNWIVGDDNMVIETHELNYTTCADLIDDSNPAGDVVSVPDLMNLLNRLVGNALVPMPCIVL